MSEGGLRETEEAVRFLQSQDITQIWTSPLRRCRRLAEALAERLPSVVFRVEPDLIEQNFGLWEGRTAREISALYPQEWESFQKNRCRFQPPAGEAHSEVERRALSVLTRALQTPDDTVALITHYNVIISILWFISDLPPCAITDLPYPPGAVMRVEKVNPGWRGYFVFRPDSGKWFLA